MKPGNSSRIIYASRPGAAGEEAKRCLQTATELTASDLLESCREQPWHVARTIPRDGIGARRIQILVPAGNKASVRAARKTGFVQEGSPRNPFVLHERIHDAVMVPLIARDLDRGHSQPTNVLHGPDSGPDTCAATGHSTTS